MKQWGEGLIWFVILCAYSSLVVENLHVALLSPLHCSVFAAVTRITLKQCVPSWDCFTYLVGTPAFEAVMQLVQTQQEHTNQLQVNHRYPHVFRNMNVI